MVETYQGSDKTAISDLLLVVDPLKGFDQKLRRLRGVLEIKTLTLRIRHLLSIFSLPHIPLHAQTWYKP